MYLNTARASYIIDFCNTNEEQKSALLFVVSLLRKYFPKLEIIVVEQDVTPKLELDQSLNVRQIFFHNSGAYNHYRAYNEGAKNSNREILIFATPDMFLSYEGYLACFREIEIFEAVTSNKSELSNVVITHSQDHHFELLSNTPLYTFAEGILLMTRKSFEKLGGWDECFEEAKGGYDAMSHVIFNKLTSKTLCLPMFHIENSRNVAGGKDQIKQAENRMLSDEITSLYGTALDHYVEFLQIKNGFKKGISFNTKKQAKFILAVTTFNRFDYLKKCIDSFLNTRNTDADWQLIIADDGSTDETTNYLKTLETNHDAIIIRNSGTDIHRQINSILKKLKELDFDLCFRCDDDMIFLQKGWDDLYWKTIQRTGYDHLIFYDKNWRPHVNLSQPIQAGGLISNCPAESIQGGFYTLTKRVLKEVGYFDEQLFGRRGLGHVDYSFRCCRAGFNVLANPFDAKDSNYFLCLQSADNYKGSVTSLYKSKLNPKGILALKKRLIRMERQYIPFNQNYLELDSHYSTDNKQSKSRRTKKTATINRFRRANATFYPERGIRSLFGFLLKRFYNLGIDLRLFFIPAGIKKLGKILNKISLDLLNVEE